MKKRNILFVLTLSLAATMQAASTDDKPQVIQKATLKNGSVLYGFIQKNDGRGNLTFQTDSAVINLEELRAEVSDRQVNENALSKEWKEWADANNAYMGTGNNRYVVLSDVRMQSSAVIDSAINARQGNSGGRFLQSMRDKAFVSNVKVLERGVRTRYIEQLPNSYQINWYDIVAITTDPRPKTALSGINRIYHTKDGSYEGQYAGETRTTLSLYLPTGVMQTLNYADVKKYTYRPLNPNQNIFEQSELLDVVYVRNGAPVSGIIIEQDYTGKDATENSVLVQQETGTFQSVKVSNIVEVAKQRNPKYKPLYDIVLADNEVCVNRNMVKQTAVDAKKGVHTLQKLDPVVLQRGANNLTQVTVEYKASYGNNVEAYQLVRLYVEGKGKKAKYFFTDSDLANTTYRPISITTSVNGTTKAAYQVTSDGGYVLYNPRTKTAYAFVVQPEGAK